MRVDIAWCVKTSAEARALAPLPACSACHALRTPGPPPASQPPRRSSGHKGRAQRGSRSAAPIRVSVRPSSAPTRPARFTSARRPSSGMASATPSASVDSSCMSSMMLEMPLQGGQGWEQGQALGQRARRRQEPAPRLACTAAPALAPALPVLLQDHQASAVCCLMLIVGAAKGSVQHPAVPAFCATLTRAPLPAATR